MTGFSDPHRRWSDKFRDAFRGVRVGICGQSSFRVHLSMAVLVVVAAVFLRVNLVEWCVLVLCVANVLAAEMFNSALESLARSITSSHNENIADALDVASAAVLLAAVGAAVVGAVIFGFRLGVTCGWWEIYTVM